MRTLSLLALLPFAAHAQPGELFLDLCASGSYDVPLQNMARNDVRVATTSIGTDDVPSSSGNCIRQVMLAEHADFLLERNHQGDYLIAEPKAGDVLHHDSLQAGIASGRLRWGKYNMPICYKGYGAQHDGKGWHLVEPRTWERSVVRLTTPDGIFIMQMTVRCLEPDGVIDVRGGPVMIAGTPYIIR